MAIPKVIHYCWFGRNKLPETAEKCINSWKTYFPDYEIKEWNESNYDVNKIIFTKEAYKAGMYAFVSDYARLDILFNYGGIYFDTDVEVIKGFGNVLQNSVFMGFESLGCVNPGLGMGSEPHNSVLLEIMEYYRKKHVLNKKGKNNTRTIVSITSEILKKYGLKNNNAIQNIAGIRIYPEEYFSPKSFETGITKITENTCSIHHFDGSWVTKEGHKSTQERWDFYKKYWNDEYVVNIYKKMKEYEKRTVDNFSLKILYKIIIKRTLKKLMGERIIGWIKSKKNGT